jgi:REP element-mobilizing transposase RayT
MTGDPLAYFITFSCYGNWLHGDERLSVRRGSDGPALCLPNPGLVNFERSEMDQPPYFLDHVRQEIVLRTIQEVAKYRGWVLLAAHVRTNHLHVVIRAEAPPERVMNDLKSYASRRLNEAAVDTPGRKRWTRHGSTLYLWTEEAVTYKISYTVLEQGEPMACYVDAEFDPRRGTVPGPTVREGASEAPAT